MKAIAVMKSALGKQAERWRQLAGLVNKDSGGWVWLGGSGWSAVSAQVFIRP